MELQTDVDPSIEGGFIFDINDFRLDASIATQLKRGNSSSLIRTEELYNSG